MSGREGERGEGERCARAVAQAGKEEAGGEAAAAASIRSIECQVRQRAKATPRTHSRDFAFFYYYDF